MATKEEIARKRADKAKANLLEAARISQAAEKSLSEIKHNADTHRKILEGVTAIYGCAHSEEFRRMHEQFRLEALTLNSNYSPPSFVSAGPRLAFPPGHC